MFAIHLLEDSENNSCAACFEQKEVIELSMGRESLRGEFVRGRTTIRICADCASKLKSVLAIIARDKT